MKLEDLCDGLLDALEAFDTSILPLGLYSSDEVTTKHGQRAQRLGDYQEWPRAIVPLLTVRSAGGTSMMSNGGAKLWNLDGLGLVEIRAKRISKIKVRRYGSGYQLDKRERRDWGIEQLDAIRPMMLRRPEPPRDTPHSAILLLIAFDKTLTPLGGDIRDLNEDLALEKNQILFRTRCWKDKAQRGFGVRIAAWARHA